MVKELEEAAVSREEAAERLETLADALRAEGEFDVTVGNRTVHLSPPGEIGLEVGVREKASRLRGDRESVTIKMDWQPE